MVAELQPEQTVGWEKSFTQAITHEASFSKVRIN